MFRQLNRWLSESRTRLFHRRVPPSHQQSNFLSGLHLWNLRVPPAFHMSQNQLLMISTVWIPLYIILLDLWIWYIHTRKQILFYICLNTVQCMQYLHVWQIIILISPYKTMLTNWCTGHNTGKFILPSLSGKEHTTYAWNNFIIISYYML